MFSSQSLESEAGRLYEHLRHVSVFPGRKWSLEQCSAIAPLTLKINSLKKEKKAVILAHYYVPPEIVFGVADFYGDSYALSEFASRAQQKNIVFAGVFFMAETAKILNPAKTVLSPAGHAGCTLAQAVTQRELADFKARHPGVPVVCYINSSAEVKAECDACVTSSNVYDIIAKIPGEKVIFTPDTLMAENVRIELGARGIKKEVISFGGSCCVHDQYMPFHIEEMRAKVKDIKILCHPECPADVVAAADYTGSTSGMLSYVAQSNDKDFGVFTEYGLVNRLEHDNPGKNFHWAFGKCSFMKRNSLENILSALEAPSEEQTVTVSADTAVRAKKCVDAMFTLAKK